MIRALKGCRFCGKDYSAGEIVPTEAVDSKMIGALKKLKMIEVTGDVQLRPKPDKRRKPKPIKV